jgi:hypothetical protein
MKYWIIQIGCYFILVILMNSCMGLVKVAFPGAYSSEELFRSAKKLAKAQKGYYKIQKNGDTLTTTSKEALRIIEKEYKFGYEPSSKNIVECSTKYGIVKWNGFKWVTYIVKGKINMYYSFSTSGYNTVQNFNSGTGAPTTVSHQASHRFQFYFEKESKGIVGVESIEHIRQELGDNENCLKKINTLVPAGKNMDDTKVTRLIDIVKFYNKQ